MMMESTKNDYQGDEIEVSRLVLKGVTLIKQNLISLVLFLVGGIIAGVLFYNTKTPVYESSMLVSTGIVKSSVVSSLLDEVQELIGEQNNTSISEKLNLKDATSKLKMIETEEVDEKADKGKTDIIKIIVRVTEVGILEDLEPALIQYLEQNKYVQKRVAIKKDNINKEIDFLSKELEDVSKLKSDVSKIGEKGNITSASFDLEDIYRQSMQLFERKLELEYDLKTIENFQIIQGFTAYQKPVSPKLSISLVGGVVAGLILAFLFIFFKEFSKHLKTLENESKAEHLSK